MKLRVISLLVFCFANSAFAAYPEKSIRLVVPFATGGTSEIVARSVANGLTNALGQSVYVDNSPVALAISQWLKSSARHLMATR